jgi:hypothetical protein
VRCSSSDGKRCPVEVQGHADVAVPEALLDGLGMGSELDEQRCTGVLQVVGPHCLRQARGPERGDHHPLPEAVTVEPAGGIVLSAEHPVVRTERRPQLRSPGGEMRLGLRGDEAGERDRAHLVGLRWPRDEFTADRLERLGDVDPPAEQVEPLDPETAELAGSETGVRGEHDEEPGLVPGLVDEAPHLLGGQEPCLGSCCSW